VAERLIKRVITSLIKIVHVLDDFNCLILLNTIVTLYLQHYFYHKAYRVLCCDQQNRLEVKKTSCKLKLVSLPVGCNWKLDTSRCFRQGLNFNKRVFNAKQAS